MVPPPKRTRSTRTAAGAPARDKRKANNAPEMEDPSAKRQKLNFARLTAKRTYVREQVRELQKTLDKEKKKKTEHDVGSLEMCQVKFEQYRKELESYDSAIQDELEGDDLTRDVNESERILDFLKTSVFELDVLLKRAGRSAGGSIGGAGQAASGDQQGVVVEGGVRAAAKLPRLEIGKFGGDPIRYQEFWDQFSCSVHNNSALSNVEKFSYLKTLLIGDALRAIDGIALSNANYSMAIDILKDRFGDQETVIATHFDNIVTLSMASPRTADLRAFYDTMEKHIRSLQALGLKDEEFSKTFVPMILRKIPHGIKLELNRKRGSQPWDLATLRRLLKEEIGARENTQANSEQTAGKFSQRKSLDFPHTGAGTASALISHAQGRNQHFTQNRGFSKRCGYCGDSHFSDECPVFSDVESRKRKLGKRCYVCLRTGHLTDTCDYHSCFYCGGRHHRSLCFKKFGGSKTSKEFSMGSYKRHIVLDANTTQKRQMAPDTIAGKTGGTSARPKSQSIAMLAPSQRTIMPTALTMVESPSRKTKAMACRLVLDTASQRSYITQDLATKLQLVPFGTEQLELGGFRSNETTEDTLPIAAVRLRTKTGNIFDMTVNIISTICVPIRKDKVDIEDCSFISGLTLAEPLKDCAEDIHLDMLIGYDYYNDVLGDRRLKLKDGLYLTQSIFGWLLGGRVAASGESDKSPNMTMLAPVRGASILPVDSSMERFWNLESVGIREDAHSKDDEVAMKGFLETVAFKNGRYEVRWPWKEPVMELPQNFELASGRLKSLSKRLDAQPEVHQKYSEIIHQQLDDGIIERVLPNSESGDKVHYLPHHGVVRKDAISTKLRIVYDASSKAQKDLNSLNDCLYRGPVLLTDLCGLLMRFRMGPIGILSDIEKAFLQIGLNPVDRDVTRFLWYDSQGNLEPYRFKRVPFGVISSPFLLAATVNYHLNSIGSSVAQQIRDNIYVDNVCVSVDSVEEAKGFYDDAKLLLSRASMNLREWFSNSDEFMHHVSYEDRLIGEKIKVLGMNWYKDIDALGLRGSKFHIDGLMTKRKFLALIASFFDPLGLFSPILTRAKILFQNLWKLNLNWDSPIPDDLRSDLDTVQTDLNGIFALTVPRFLGFRNSDSNIHLHCFCDSSQSVYAAAVYLRLSNSSQTTSRLIFAKNRLAPIKTLTIPRLELMAVLIGVRLLTCVELQLKLVISSKFIWTDSQCVLSWVSSPKLRSLFVENRLKEIRSHTDIHFRYVPTSENPADLPTRGVSASDVRSLNFWWGGPHWLEKEIDHWPKQDESSTHVEKFDELEVRKSNITLATVEKPMDDCLGPLLERCSSLNKLLRITAYILRAKERFLKANSQQRGALTVNELTRARLFWDKRVQDNSYSGEKRLLASGGKNNLISDLGLFVDDLGLIRCRGRLQHAELPEETKNPILVSGKGKYAALLIDHVHRKLMHSGVRHVLVELRRNYWIPAVRPIIRRIIRHCSLCRKWEGGPFQPPREPALLKERLLQSPTFTFVGIDYLGPLIIRPAPNCNSKVWICIFTCAVTRAIHLEVVPSMTTEDFIDAFRRFIARRGAPSLVICDNAKQFKLADSLTRKLWASVVNDSRVHSYITSEGIKWKFIVQLAPWMGGFYERLVGLVKRCLRKTINSQLLTFRQLETLTIEAEAVLNSRPLGFVGSDVDTTDVITPATFLGINGRAGIPILDYDCDDPPFVGKAETADVLLNKWKRQQLLLDRFWKQFREEYLVGLRERFHRNQIRGAVRYCPEVGQAVLIKDNLPRGQWKMGIIDHLNRGTDGMVRSAVIRTKGKAKLNRPLALIYPLEYLSVRTSANSEDLNLQTEETSLHLQPQPALRRSTRRAAAEATAAISNLYKE